MGTVKIVVAVVLIAAAFAGLARFEFKVWRGKHPTAPTWTFFVDD